MSEDSESNNRNLDQYTYFIGMAKLANHLLAEISSTVDSEEKFDNNADSLLKEAEKKRKQFQDKINAKRKQIEEEFEQ